MIDLAKTRTYQLADGRPVELLEQSKIIGSKRIYVGLVDGGGHYYHWDGDGRLWGENLKGMDLIEANT